MNTLFDDAVLKQIIDAFSFVIKSVLVWKYIGLCIAVNFFIDKAFTPMLTRKAFVMDEERIVGRNQTWAYSIMKTPRSIRAMVANLIILTIYAKLNCAIDFGENKLHCIAYLFISMLAVPAVYQYTLKRLMNFSFKNNDKK